MGVHIHINIYFDTDVSVLNFYFEKKEEEEKTSKREEVLMSFKQNKS